MAAARGLAVDPNPAASSPLGDSGFHRLKLGDLRITYDVDSDQQVVQIYLVGKVPSARGR